MLSESHRDLKADPCEIAANLASIKSTPLSILPSGEARDALMRWARDGRDVYCYTSGGPRGTPCVWIERERIPLAQWPEIFAARKAKGAYDA